MKRFAFLSCIFMLLLGLPQYSFGNVWNMGTLEERVSINEEKIEKIESQLARLMLKLGEKDVVCKCSEGEKCICDARTCECKDCPEHTQYIQDKPKTEWQGKANGNGRSAVIYSSDDCINCFKLKGQVVDQAANIEVKQFESIADSPYDSLPYVALKENGETVMYLHSTACSKERIENWLNGSMNVQQPKYVTPSYSNPNTNINFLPLNFNAINFGGGCANGACYRR